MSGLPQRSWYSRIAVAPPLPSLVLPRLKISGIYFFKAPQPTLPALGPSLAGISQYV